jgi:hypothetical protein
LNVHDLDIIATPVQSLLAATDQGIWKYTRGNLPHLQAAPSTLAFLGEYDSTSAMTLSMEITGTPGLSWTATESPAVGWLGISPADGETPATADVVVDVTGLVTGTYTTTLILYAGPEVENSPWPVAVRLVVSTLQRVYLPIITK